MKIAVIQKEGMIWPDFASAPAIKVYQVNRAHEIEETQILRTEAPGYAHVAGLLLTNGIQGVICGGIGKHAFDMLVNMRIHIFAGVGGSADDAVARLLRRELTELVPGACGHLEEESGACSGDCASCAYH